MDNEIFSLLLRYTTAFNVFIPAGAAALTAAAAASLLAVVGVAAGVGGPVADQQGRVEVKSGGALHPEIINH